MDRQALAGELAGQCKGPEQKVGPIQSSTKPEYPVRAPSRTEALVDIFSILGSAHICVRLQRSGGGEEN